MGELKGFLKYNRINKTNEKVKQRVKHWNEFQISMKDDKLAKQGARCMDCGIPFCQFGCPVGNLIPEWNDLVYKNQWELAYRRLSKTNNFPEFTGRICPAPCEDSCVLGYNNPAVSIKNIEHAIIEKAFENGWVKSRVPKKRTGKKAAVVGSGPAGLACADILNRYGHEVTVYEKNSHPGGLLTFGIPNFKLEKWIVKRRIDLMEEEGIRFKTNIEIGKSLNLSELKNNFDAVILCGGAEKPRDLKIPGRELDGVHYAMEFLTDQIKYNLNIKSSDEIISARDKNVVVIGGGDTGSDCFGTSIRQGAKSVVNLELMPKPPKERAKDNPWPQWAKIERVSSSHEEGCERHFAKMTKEFVAKNGKISSLKVIDLNWNNRNGSMDFDEIVGSESEIKADLVLLALGFTGPNKKGMLEEYDFEFDNRGNLISNENHMTNIEGIFTAGDMRRGQSLVVWAINEGRNAAENVHEFLIQK